MMELLNMYRRIKYKALNKFLEALGFQRRYKGNHIIYENDKGTLIILPRYRPNDTVVRMHLAAIRRTLIESGILNREEFESIFYVKH